MFYIGEGGLNFYSPATKASYSIGYGKDDDVVTLKPWHGSFSIGQEGDAGVFRFRANGVLDTDNEVGEAKTITFNCKVEHAAGGVRTITVKGHGTVRFNGAYTFSQAKNMILEDTARLEIGAKANTSTGTLTLGAGTTLALVDGIVALKNSQVITPAEGTATLFIGGSTLSEGEYDIFPNTSQFLAPDWSEHIELIFENNPASPARLFSPDGVKIKLLVGSEDDMSTFVWTGAAGDGKMNTSGNWLFGAVPGKGSNVYFPIASGEIQNDISEFAPKSITFGARISDVTVSGNAFSSLYAVTNLSAEANVTFDAKVSFVERPNIYQKVSVNDGYISNPKGMLIFNGGSESPYMLDNASGSHNAFAGHFKRTANSNYVATRSSHYRQTLYQNSSLTVSSSENTYHLFIGKGGAFTTETANVSSASRICAANGGEYVVNGTLTHNSTSEMKGACYNGESKWVGYSTDAVYKVGEIKIGGSAAFGFSGDTNNSNFPITNTWFIGEGGLKLTSGQGAFYFTRNAGDRVNIRPWRSDFTISGGTTALGDIYVGARTQNGGMIAFITDDENGIARKITVDGKIACRDEIKASCHLVVGGKGEVQLNSVSEFSGDTVVEDGATLSFSSGAQLGTGPISFERGTTLSVKESGNVDFAGIVDFDFGSRIALNFTDRKAAPLLNFKSEVDISLKSIILSITADEGVESMNPNGRWCIATGLTSDTTSYNFIVADKPSWVNKITPISVEDGKLYLNVQKQGFSVIVR
jgi:hypothetical protein